MEQTAGSKRAKITHRSSSRTAPPTALIPPHPPDPMPSQIESSPPAAVRSTSSLAATFTILLPTMAIPTAEDEIVLDDECGEVVPQDLFVLFPHSFSPHVPKLKSLLQEAASQAQLPLSPSSLTSSKLSSYAGKPPISPSEMAARLSFQDPADYECLLNHKSFLVTIPPNSYTLTLYASILPVSSIVSHHAFAIPELFAQAITFSFRNYHN